MERIRVENVSYSYRTKYQTIEALKGVSCAFDAARMYAVVGESGSGKSTFLSLLAGLDVPVSGDIYIEGKSLRQKDRDLYRRDMVSVIYQAFHLFPLLTALENVMVPMQLQGMSTKTACSRAKELILRVGLPEKTFCQFPEMMSGGEQQRVAIARGLAAGGKILLADEPTGNLDSGNERHIVDILKQCARQDGLTVIVITHNPAVAGEADRIYRMHDGYLETNW